MFYSQISNSLSESSSFSLYSLISGKQLEQTEYSCKVASNFTLKDGSFLVCWQLWQVKEVLRVGFVCSLVFFLKTCQQGWHNLPSGSSRTKREISL